MRVVATVTLIAAIAVCSASAREGLGPRTIAAFRGQVLGVAQDARSIAWLQASPDGCSLRIRSRSGGAIRSFRYAASCNPFEHELVLAGGRPAWGGNDEILCGKTYASVYTVAGARSTRVQKIPGDCLGFGASFRGLASDGGSIFYNVLQTLRPASAWQCGEGGACRWELAGGRIVRIDGSRAVALRGLPPTPFFAVGAGRIAVVEPLRKASSSGGWPRAARNGRVEIRSLATGRVEASFRPQGIVRAIALSGSVALVAVELLGSRSIESYDARNGRRLRAYAVPQGPWRRIATDGRFVAFSLRRGIRVELRALDLRSGRDEIVATTRGNPIGPSIFDGTLVWGENGTRFARVVAARVL